VPAWLPPLLGGSIAILLLWVGLGIKRFRERRPLWAAKLARELRRWDGRLPNDLNKSVISSPKKGRR
jgi:hypothetical protein